MIKNYINWERVDWGVDYIVSEVKEKYPNIEAIYAIPRGGLILGVMLSHRLNIPLLNTPYNLYNYEGVLIVDEIADSGKTLAEFKDIQNVITATMHKRYNSTYTPDICFCEVETDDWIVYPWEVL